MTIRAIETILLDLPYDIWGPKPTFAGKPRKRELLLVRVETDRGLVGWGEAFGYSVAATTRMAIEDTIKPLVLGRDEDDIAGISLALQKQLQLCGRSGPVMFALSGLDIALWDIAGKKAGKPVWALLGGTPRTSLPAYASMMHYGDPAIVARNAAAAAAAGYGAIKLHEKSAEHLRAAREAVGPGVKLMMDVNCAWTPDEAIDKAREFAPYDTYWLEEPTWPTEDYASCARVRREGGLTIAGGENAVSPNAFADMIAAGSVDIVQPSVTKVGGITEAARVARLARERGVRCIPHSPYFGPGFIATLHVAAALCGDTMIEAYWCSLGVNPMGEGNVVKNGMIAVPQSPGLGCDPDPATFARCTG